MDRVDYQQTKTIPACADVTSPLEMPGWCLPSSHHQERLCAHLGAPLLLSQPREQGISLPMLASPSPFVSPLHLFQYFREQSLGKPVSSLGSSAAIRSLAPPVATGSSALEDAAECQQIPATPCWRSWTSPSDLELFATFLQKT